MKTNWMVAVVVVALLAMSFPVQADCRHNRGIGGLVSVGVYRGGSYYSSSNYSTSGCYYGPEAQARADYIRAEADLVEARAENERQGISPALSAWACEAGRRQHCLDEQTKLKSVELACTRTPAECHPAVPAMPQIKDGMVMIPLKDFWARLHGEMGFGKEPETVEKSPAPKEKPPAPVSELQLDRVLMIFAIFLLIALIILVLAKRRPVVAAATPPAPTAPAPHP